MISLYWVRQLIIDVPTFSVDGSSNADHAKPDGITVNTVNKVTVIQFKLTEVSITP